MIHSAVNTRRKGLITLRITGPNGAFEDVEAVVDTGFTGFLVLHRYIVACLGLTFLGRGLGNLATGESARMDVYGAEVYWDGTARTIYALAGDGPTLAGASLLYGYVLTFEAVDGGRVIIEKL